LKRHLILSAVSYLFLARVRQEERGENPELTVCQLHTAVAALVRSWGLSSPRAKEKLLARAAKKIAWHQRRNAVAHKSHIKWTRKKLRALGIKFSELKRCQWDST
jgi:hypothetical protein